VLTRDVRQRSRVAADQEGAETWRDAAGLELGDAVREFGLHGGRGGDTVELYCSHFGFSGSSDGFLMVDVAVLE
jgi:hypothetical protein